MTELAKPFAMSQPAISKHLKVLERAGLVSRRRDAQRRPCRLEAARLKAATDWLAGTGGTGRGASSASTHCSTNCRPKERTRHDRLRHPGGEHRVRPEIVMTRSFAAPRQVVFDAWTRPELLKRWYNPLPWQLVECDIDLRVGGAWRFRSEGPDGASMVQGGVYRGSSRPSASCPPSG